MPESEHADNSGRLVESHQARDPRVLAFAVLIAILLVILAAGLAYRQLIQSSQLRESERLQTQRRILIPGPRGNIYDRFGRLLVGNQPRFSVVLYLDELQAEFRRESIRIRNNYRATGDKELPSWSQMEQIAHASVAQNFLNQVDAITGRHDRIDAAALTRHFERQLYMPYTLINDLTSREFAELLEELPVSSPLQLYTAVERYYPYGSAASHVLGYVGAEEAPAAEDFPGEDLKTFPMPGTIGREGLEKSFDAHLQGQPGGSIFRVDPAGYKVKPALDVRQPIQGHNLISSLDVDLQVVAENAIGDRIGAAVALDVRTGEVLLMASKPDYNLNDFSPRLSAATAADIQKRGAWLNLAIGGVYPPGSTFKTVVTMAGQRHGTLLPDDTSVDCEGEIRIGNSLKGCDNGRGRHGHVDLRAAIGESCDIYFYEHGLRIGPDAIADEARRFRLDQPTGIELAGESRRMLIPDRDWKKRTRDEAWTDGDTANMAIGQGFVQVTPIQMACYVASLARGEISTHPILVHDPDRPAQHSDPIGLSAAQRAVLLDGMEACTNTTYPDDTAYILSTIEAYKVPGVRIAGKTGTAQYGNHLNVAWFICFAPIENPEIAVAVAVQSDQPGEGYVGGITAAPVGALILKKYFEKKSGQVVGQIAVR